jgi:hypothetical protein
MYKGRRWSRTSDRSDSASAFVTSDEGQLSGNGPISLVRVKIGVADAGVLERTARLSE